MNHKPPRTPFSTALSGSAKETERRIRNIFSGPKKRPPLLLLVLVFSLCIFCGNLVSCQVAEAEKELPPPDLSLVSVDWDSLPELDPTYTLEENGNVRIKGLEGGWAVWSRHSSGNYLYLAGDPAFCCPSLAGRTAEGSACWQDEPWGSVVADISINDDRLEDGTIDGYYLHFVADWGKEKVIESSFTSDIGDGTLELSEKEMLYASRVLARIMTEADEAYHTPSLEVGTLPFDQPMELMFASGAGAWQTMLLLHPDGSFEGDYCDADMTTQYVCQFHGRFTDITQVTDTSWSMTLEELTLDTQYPVGEEWDEEPYHYISSEPYGFDDSDYKALRPGAQFMLYSPEAKGYAPSDDLYGMNGDDGSALYGFWSWWPNKHGWGPYGDTLDGWGLHNLTSGRGFFDLHAWGIA